MPQRQETYIILAFLKRVHRRFIEPLQYINFDNSTFSASHVIQNAIDRLLRVISRNGGFGISEQLSIRLQSVRRPMEYKKEELCGLL
jgi:hypothetical protein